MINRIRDRPYQILQKICTKEKTNQMGNVDYDYKTTAFQNFHKRANKVSRQRGSVVSRLLLQKQDTKPLIQ